MEPKLLLVDDEEGIRIVLGMYLEDEGYQVLTAGNGEEGLAIFRDENPAIVLTDIKMPGVGGVELLQTIKAESPDTEVIMLTGHGDMDLAIQSLKAEATDFITKPINDDALGIALKRANERIDMRRQLREYTENLERLVEEKSAKLIEAERSLAVCQVVEGISDSMKNLAGDLEEGIQFFNDLPCFVSIHNSDLKVVEVNPLYLDRLGDKVGSPSSEVYLGMEPGDCPVGRTFHGGKGRSSREVVICKNGNELPVMVHTAPIKNSGGGVEMVLEIAADVTEVTRLREELRVTQQKFQQLFQEAPCYISVQDLDYRLTEVNRCFTDDFGDRIGDYCYEVYRHRKEPCHDCSLTATFADGRTHQMETVVTSQSGEQYNVLVYTAPIRNAAGEITHGMEMSTNITQIRKLQDHLTSLGLLIGSTAHGIKGLLTALDGGVYRVGTGLKKERLDHIQDGFDTIKLMTGRIKKTVLDILYYAKNRELNWELVDVMEFAQGLAASIAAKAAGAQIEFRTDFASGLGDFEVDSGVLSPALVNILENAVEACTDDQAKSEHSIEFKVTAEDRFIRFAIADNAMGMDPETREKLFTLFFSSKGSKGTGIGLFVANQVAGQHGGSLEVESEPGKGACFIMRLPKTLPAAAKTAAVR